MGQLFLLWGPWEKSKVSLKAKAKKVYGWGGHFLFININSFFFHLLGDLGFFSRSFGFILIIVLLN